MPQLRNFAGKKFRISARQKPSLVSPTNLSEKSVQTEKLILRGRFRERERESAPERVFRERCVPQIFQRKKQWRNPLPQMAFPLFSQTHLRILPQNSQKSSFKSQISRQSETDISEILLSLNIGFHFVYFFLLKFR